MTAKETRKHFSMIRSFHFADLFTIANGCCGIAAVFHAMKFLERQSRTDVYIRSEERRVGKECRL